MAKRKITPSKLELEILGVLWEARANEQTPLAVRDVRQRLADAGRQLAHTSVITVLNIMADKKMLRRSKRKNASYFTPVVEQAAVQSQALDDVLNRVFDGSPTQLMLSLLDRDDIHPDSIAEIRRLIKQYKAKRESS